MGRRDIGPVLRASFAAILLGACAPTVPLGASCDLTSDCPEPWVCRHQRCRVACREARDCGPGLRCVVDGQGMAVCTLAPEETCSASSPCPGDLRCVDGECRTECGGVAVCTSAGVCRDGTCVEPSFGDDTGPPADSPACTPADVLVCSDGVIQQCDVDLDEVAGVMTRGTGGEAGVLSPLVLGPHTWPHAPADSAADPPEIAVAASRAGFGVVAYVEDERALRAHQFSLRALNTGAPVAWSDPPLSTVSVALAENGDEITGFAQGATPDSDGGLSALRLTLVSTGGGSWSTLSAGTPRATNGRRVTIIGGVRAVTESDEPVFYLTRERRPTGQPAVGAIDEMISMAGYRATGTAALGAGLDLEVAGSGGGIGIFRDGGPSIGIWNVARTETLAVGGLADDLEVVDVGAAGEPSIASRSAVNHLLAVPVEVSTPMGPVGYVRFFDLVCPAIGACNAPAPRPSADLLARDGRVPLAVRLVPLPGGGYAAAVLERTGLVFVWILDQSLVPVLEETRMPIVEPGPGEHIVAIDAASSRTSATVTVLVAALLRNDMAREDRVVVTGIDACLAR